MRLLHLDSDRLRKIPATLVLAAVCISIFLLTADRAGNLRADLLQQWGFSWATFLDSPVRALALSPWLHFNVPHIATNLVILILFCSALEARAGSLRMVGVFLLAALISNPLTVVLVNHLLRFLTPIGRQTVDVGASLGIFGCAGALIHRLKRGKVPLLCGLFLYGVGQGLVVGWIGLDHCVALMVGLLF